MSETRIAFFVPKLNGGGAERVFVNLANELCKYRKFKIFLILCRSGGPYADSIDERVNAINLGEIHLSMALFPLLKAVKRERITVLISAMPVPNLVAVVLKILRPSMTVVLTEHNDIRQQLSQVSVAWIKKLTPLIIRYFYSCADQIVCVSHGVAKFVVSLRYELEKKVTVIYNPVFSEEIESLSNEKLESEVFSGHGLKLLAVGRLTEQKNIGLFIDTIYELKSRGEVVEACILGDGPKWSELQEKIDRLGLRDQVTILGFQINPYKYMSRSDVFVLTSLWEGFGNVLVEAAACGAKIVSVDCPSGPREIIDMLGFGRLADSASASSLAQAILDENCKKSVVSKDRLMAFHVALVAEQYMKIWAKL